MMRQSPTQRLKASALAAKRKRDARGLGRYEVELTSDRLRLTPAIDRLNGARAFTRPGSGKFIGTPDNSGAVWLSLATMIGHWHLRGYGHFVVRRRDTGAAIGMVGPWFPMGWPEPELSWHMLEGSQGNGFASEAAELLRDWLMTQMGWGTLISLIADTNGASIALAKRLDATPEDVIETDMMGPLRVWRHQKPNGEGVIQ